MDRVSGGQRPGGVKDGVADTDELIGKEFPRGSLTIRGWKDELLRDLIDAPKGEGGFAHPLWALTGALSGLGTDIDGIVAAVGATMDPPPLFAGCELEHPDRLRVDIPYEVRGRIVALEHKVGRRTGPFRLYSFEIDLLDDGTRVSRASFAWVMPERGRA